MNKLVLFTSHFPYHSIGESFLESELWGLSKGFDEIYIVTCEIREKMPEIKKILPPNCVSIHLKRSQSLSDLFLSSLLCPFKAFFWKELCYIIKEKKPFVASLKSALYASSSFIAIKRLLPSAIKQINISKDDKVVLMGYWFHFISEVALAFKKLLGRNDIKVAARAHGSSDIRNFANSQKYYPFQADLLKRSDAVFAVSQNGCEYLRSLCLEPSKIKRIYIGSDGPDHSIERSRTPFTVVSCSSIIPLKRVGLIADAVRILSKKIPDIRWVHFGDGPLRDFLETSCADIQQYVNFMGHTLHSEMFSYLASGEASVFVSASSTEGLPISVVEAIAHSLPVVATDVGSTREAVIDGVCGTLLPADITAKQLADSIFKYYSMNDSEYNAISQKAFALWQQEFDCKKNSAIMVSELKQL